jgi:DNA polymerase-3 subunit delta'
VSDTESDREGTLPHPRDVTELFGHDEAWRLLSQALAQERVPPAFLLGGSRGLGKATLAYRFARQLLGGGETAARLVSAQAHPDLLVLRRPYDEKGKRLKSNIPVEEVRRIHALFGLRASGAGYRVCIVDVADDLNTAAANALLKTLEEPPARSVFLLVAHAPARLLPTIRSRCRRVMLKPLDESAMSAFLDAKLPTLAQAERQRLALLAGGRPGRALMLAEAGGLDLYAELIRLVTSLPKGDPARLHHFAEKLSRPAEEQSYRTAMELLTALIARLIETRSGLKPAQEADLERLQGRGSLEGWAELWEKVTGLVARADALSLDRRQVILTSFEGIARQIQSA